MSFPDKMLSIYDGTHIVISGFIGMVESVFMDTVTRLAPILAPLPPAFAVYTAMSLRTPQWVSISTALSIELIGMFSSKVAVQSWNWNRTRLKAEPAAPFTLALSMAAVYFIVVLLLALGIEIWADSLIILYPGFVIIAAATYVTNAVNVDMHTWRRDREERIKLQKEKTGLAAEIRAAKIDLAKLADQRLKIAAENSRQKEKLAGQSNGHIAAKMDHITPNTAKKAKISRRRETVLGLKNKGLTHQEIADNLAVSLGTIKKDVAALNTNGNGYEVKL